VRHRTSFFAAIFVTFAGGLVAQNGSQFRDWKATSGDVIQPSLRCTDVRSLTSYEFSVATADSVAGSAETPAFCRITGNILPQIQFELSLPASWNGRLYMFGNGGYAGERIDSPGRAGYRDRALRHGFAVTQMNTGHDGVLEPLGSFAVDRQKLLDYAFRSLHVTAVTAKRLIAAYYGRETAKSYFDGCSTGGRQGLILAQRFPSDFDGIVVGAPVLNFSRIMLTYAWINQALAQAPIAESLMKPLAERIYSQCDAKDGLADGVIEDPRRCGFSAARDLPKCQAGGDSSGCFTDAQIQALEKIYSGLSKNGETIVPGWPVGAEIAGPNGKSGWFPWFVRDDGQSTISKNFGETFFRYLAFPQTDPKYELAAVDFDKDPGRLRWISSVLDAVDPDLTRFRDRGGKILMYYGWAEPALNPLFGVEYYDKVSSLLGASTPDFFRLFLVPGMFHCSGGIGTGTFDPMPPLADWVERGKAPQQIPALRIVDGKTVRSRPLCAYPEIAKYKGSGSIDDAANFTCAQSR
jgi:feruloyl esterase